MSEKKLIESMLRLALNDLEKPDHRQDALKWLESDSDEPFSCKWICECLGFSRQELLGLIQSNQLNFSLLRAAATPDRYSRSKKSTGKAKKRGRPRKSI
jgi:hypothetical protein